MKPLARLTLLLVAPLALAAVPRASSGSNPPGSSSSSGSASAAATAFRPDLAIESITKHSAFGVRVVIKNRGPLSAGASTMRVKFSSAELGVRYVYRPIPAMSAGNQYDFAFSVEEPVYLGEIDQVIEARADYYGQVSEIRETNNVLSVSSLALF